MDTREANADQLKSSALVDLDQSVAIVCKSFAGTSCPQNQDKSSPSRYSQIKLGTHEVYVAPRDFDGSQKPAIAPTCSRVVLAILSHAQIWSSIYLMYSLLGLKDDQSAQSPFCLPPVFMRVPCSKEVLPTLETNFDRNHPRQSTTGILPPARHCRQHLPRRRTSTCYLHDTCVGQAANPGPPAPPAGQVRWVHVNPTAINGKTSMLQQLQAGIICCSETSATAPVQVETTKAFRTMGYSSVWSQPAAPHRISDNPAPEVRGKATGLSLHSYFPIRKAASDPNSLYHQASRLLRSFVSIGSIVIQVVQMYGYPRPANDAKEATEKLAQAACSEAFELNMPTILVGDFNHPPTSLPSLQVLLDHGYKTTEQLYQEFYQEQQPPTCRGATRNDAFLLSKHIVPWIKEVFVQPHAEFADHAPIGVTMRVPREALTRTILRRPHSWLERAPDAQILRDTYEKMHQQGPPDTFEHWSDRCEQAVHQAIQQQHAEQPDTFPFQGLARAQRGRCKQPKLVTISIAQPLKPAGPTQYNPQLNQASASFRQALRQLRRIQSLYRRLNKLHRDPELCPDWHQLAAEWQAICKAKLLETTFTAWLCSQPEFTEVPGFLPSLGYLYDVQQMFAHQIRNMEAHEKKRQQTAQAYQRLYDRKWGSHKQAFRALRKPSNPCLQEIWQPRSYPVKILAGRGTGLLECETEDMVPIPPRAKLTVNGNEVQLCDQRGHYIDLMLIDVEAQLQPPLNMTVSEPTMQPTKIGEALHHYWSQYWQRDHPEDTWQDFDQLLHSVPTLPQMQPREDLQIWTWAIKKLKKTTAKGTCGWAAEELQLMPPSAIEDLIHLVTKSCPNGFPPNMMLARTLPIGKTNNPEAPSQTRPITILSILYRAWGKSCCSQVLRHWAQVMPPEMIGFLPSRNMAVHMIKYQHI